MVCLPRPPQAYSIETDGRISSAVIVAYYMKYYPDAHTVSVQLWTHTNGTFDDISEIEYYSGTSLIKTTRCYLHARTVLLESYSLLLFSF
jgi:hypothetical protein